MTTPYSQHTEVIRRLFRAGAFHHAEKVLDKIPARDLGPLVRALEPAEARPLCELLLSPARIQRTLREVPSPDRGALLAPFDDVHLAELLERLPTSRSRELLQALPELRRRAVEAQVARRVPATAQASAVMGAPTLAMKAGTTAQEAIDEIRRVYTEGEMFYLYVVDGDQRLEGVVPFRRLVTSSALTPLSAIMTPRPFSIRADAPIKEAAGLLGQHDLLALPVVDVDGRFVGLVFAEDALDVMGDDEAVAAPPPAPEAPPAPQTSGGWAEWFPFALGKRGREIRARRKTAWVGGAALLALGLTGMNYLLH